MNSAGLLVRTDYVSSCGLTLIRTHTHYIFNILAKSRRNHEERSSVDQRKCVLFQSSTTIRLSWEVMCAWQDRIRVWTCNRPVQNSGMKWNLFLAFLYWLIGVKQPSAVASSRPVVKKVKQLFSAAGLSVLAGRSVVPLLCLAVVLLQSTPVFEYSLLATLRTVRCKQ